MIQIALILAIFSGTALYLLMFWDDLKDFINQIRQDY